MTNDPPPGPGSIFAVKVYFFMGGIIARKVAGIQRSRPTGATLVGWPNGATEQLAAK
jgi:hypothetical protein